MENKIQIFKNSEFGEIRTVQINDEPWFVGKDVAETLGYSDTDQSLRKHVDEEDKLTRRFDGSGQSRNMTLINESGLYSLILSSKLPTAKKFKHWVTSEVLPCIRRHGVYITSETIERIEANPDIIIQLATALKKERGKSQIILKEERERHQRELQEERDKYRTKLLEERERHQTEMEEERDYSFRTTLDFSKQANKTLQAKKEALAFKKKAKDYLFIADGMKHLLKENNIRIPANLLLYREDYEFLNEKDPQLEAFTTGKKRKKTRKQS